MLPGCTVTKLSSADPSAKFDIVFHAPEVDGRIELSMVYNADLFSEDRITIMLEQWSTFCLRSRRIRRKGLDQFTLVTPSARVCYCQIRLNHLTTLGTERSIHFFPGRLNAAR